jgi:hypothetical protein
MQLVITVTPVSDIAAFRQYSLILHTLKVKKRRCGGRTQSRCDLVFLLRPGAGIGKRHVTAKKNRFRFHYSCVAIAIGSGG